MPCNLELKTQIESFENIIDVLTKISAKYERILNQTDVYYSVSGYKLKLRIEGEVNSLIKYIRDESAPDRWSNYELLYLKGENPRKYLSEILTEGTVVEKRRILYTYKNTRIHLDEVKDLGCFLELETIVDKSEEDAQQRFNELVELLHLDLYNQIKTGYKELIESK